MSSWIDGVMYGWNWTFTDMLDPDILNRTSKIDIDTAGNQVTKPGDPDTPWVKEGGDHGVDDIMYVWGDMTGTTVALGSPTTIFEQTDVWETIGDFYSNLIIAPTQPPALPKINNIVTLPGDAGTQYIYIFGPPGTSMDEFYLEKNDGVLHNVATQIFLSGTISETMYFYVDLGVTDYLSPLGDELKLVWENPGGPGTPFGGMDVVVDRVEYNATAGGTHFGEPDNTIMLDAVPPGPTFDIHRTPMPGFDTNDCTADFIAGPEPGRPPAAPYPLSVDGVQATGPGQTISHVTNRVDPILGWTHNDPDTPPSPQFGYQLEIATDPAFAAVIWSSYQPGASGVFEENYAGPALSPGICYYYRAMTKDAYDYGPWADTEVCMNTPPPVPDNIYPANETVPPIDLQIDWTPVVDDEGDAINYELQVDEDIAFGSLYYTYFGANDANTSDYAALTTYYYRVRAHDGYEYSAGWSNESGYWWFTTTNPPITPVPDFLAVEGFFESSPGAEHITNRVNPVLNWTFTDGNAPDSQAAYDLEVRDAAGGFGNLIWADSGGAAEQVTYAGSQLAECTDYWFRVMVQDDSADALWSLWVEMGFHSNCIPTVPVLIDPPDQSLQPERAAQSLIWLSATDGDILDPITYEWVVDQDCPATVPYIASGTTSATSSAPFDTTGMAGTYFNWTVRAGDGWEWSAEATCFLFYIAIPNQQPTAATNLAVDTFTAAPEITHLLNPTPTFSWTFNDPDVGDTQGDIDVIVSTGSGGTGTVIWDPAPQAYATESIVFGGGINPQPCESYYFGILTADDKHLWADAADWAEIMFTMNCPPTVPTPNTPADTAVLTPSATQDVTWLASTDPGDTITYTVQVADNDMMTAPFLEEETTGLTSSGFDTTGLGCFWWRVNATDGWESSAWSTTFSFCANNAPGVPINLAVEGETTAPNITHIFAAEPAFNWTFVDPDGHTQTAFELSVWTGTGGTGTEMWSHTGGTAETVDYNVDSTATALELAVSYYFRVRGMDAYEFGVWAELMFELNGPPPAPTLTTPLNLETGVSLTPDLTWASGGADPNGDTVTYFWYVDTDVAPTPPYTDSNSTTGTTATVGVTLAGSTPYYWMVCADDTWEQACSAVWSFTTMVANADPIANAGTDQTVEEGDTVTLTGTGTDSDGTIALYEWDFTSDGTYDSSDATSGTTTHVYTATATATLRVTDDDGATGTDTVVITVTAAPPPDDDEKGFLEEYWWVLLIIAIIVIFVIILLAKRKKPEEEEEAPAEEEEEAPPPDDEEAEEAPEEEAEEEGAADMKECANCGTVLAADDAECFMCGAKV
ncbi:MAG: PKD domain-containing protein [Thermoplasmata archaeon]